MIYTNSIIKTHKILPQACTGRHIGQLWTIGQLQHLSWCGEVAIVLRATGPPTTSVDGDCSAAAAGAVSLVGEVVGPHPHDGTNGQLHTTFSHSGSGLRRMLEQSEIFKI